jgi:HrpA-like RNA helicase
MIAQCADRHQNGALCIQGHLQQMGVDLKRDDDTEEYPSLRRALLKGLFHNTARRNTGKGGYRLYGSGQEVQLHPASVLATTRPACVVFSEVVLTSRAYAHVATVVDAAWLPEVVPRFFANCVQG